MCALYQETQCCPEALETQVQSEFNTQSSVFQNIFILLIG